MSDKGLGLPGCCTNWRGRFSSQLVDAIISIDEVVVESVTVT